MKKLKSQSIFERILEATDSAQQAQMLSALENDPLWGKFNAEVHAHVRPFVVQLPYNLI